MRAKQTLHTAANDMFIVSCLSMCQGHSYPDERLSGLQKRYDTRGHSAAVSFNVYPTRRREGYLEFRCSTLDGDGAGGCLRAACLISSDPTKKNAPWPRHPLTKAVISRSVLMHHEPNIHLFLYFYDQRTHRQRCKLELHGQESAHSLYKRR